MFIAIKHVDSVKYQILKIIKMYKHKQLFRTSQLLN